MENMAGEMECKQLELGERYLQSPVRQNEEQGREMRITELDVSRGGLEKNKDESEAIIGGNIYSN